MNSLNPHITDSTTLSSKGQVVIPKVIREQVRWESGDALEVQLVDGEVRIRLAPPVEKAALLADVAGCLKVPGRKKLPDAQLKRRIGERLGASL
jgi:antitoxin PrlF